MIVQIGLSVLKKYAQWWMFRHFVLLLPKRLKLSPLLELLTSFSGYRKHLPNLVNASWLSRISSGMGFEPSRNGEIFWINNKWAYLRWMLFTSSSLNGRILPDKNTNALSPSSPGVISFIEMPWVNVTSLFAIPRIVSCLRWAEQQIRNKMFGISWRK